MFVLPICIPHEEYFFTKRFGKCKFHKVLFQQVADMALLWVLYLPRASSQMIHTLWHSAPGSRAPVLHGRTHTVPTSCGHMELPISYLLLPPPTWEYIKNHRTQDTDA